MEQTNSTKYHKTSNKTPQEGQQRKTKHNQRHGQQPPSNHSSPVFATPLTDSGSKTGFEGKLENRF